MYVCMYFKTWSHISWSHESQIGVKIVAEDGLELVIVLPPLFECWDYRHVMSYAVLGLKSGLVASAFLYSLNHPVAPPQSIIWGWELLGFVLRQGLDGLEFTI